MGPGEEGWEEKIGDDGGRTGGEDEKGEGMRGGEEAGQEVKIGEDGGEGYEDEVKGKGWRKHVRRNREVRVYMYVRGSKERGERMGGEIGRYM